MYVGHSWGSSKLAQSYRIILSDRPMSQQKSKASNGAGADGELQALAPDWQKEKPVHTSYIRLLIS